MKISISIFCFLLSFAASAQLKGFSIGPYIESARPAGDFQKQNGNGLGIGLSADINLPGKLSATGSAGYIHFRKYSGTEHNLQQQSAALNAMPVRAGLKYKLPLVYFKLEGGAARFTNGSGSATILSPGVGVRLLGLDVQGNYETWFKEGSQSFWGLRIAYHF